MLHSTFTRFLVNKIKMSCRDRAFQNKIWRHPLNDRTRLEANWREVNVSGLCDPARRLVSTGMETRWARATIRTLHSATPADSEKKNSSETLSCCFFFRLLLRIPAGIFRLLGRKNAAPLPAGIIFNLQLSLDAEFCGRGPKL